MSDAQAAKDPLTSLTAHIVSAYVGKHVLPPGDLPNLIAQVHVALGGLAEPVKAPAESQKPVPAVPVRKSIHSDYLICLEDGRKFKSLKRHLMTHYGMTPDDYRAKWGLPSNYPMVAPGYAARRSELAKANGLGQARKRAISLQVQDGASPKPPEDPRKTPKQKGTEAPRKSRYKAKPSAEVAE